MRNIIGTVHLYEDLRRFTEIKDTNNLQEISDLINSINYYIQHDIFNRHLLKDLQDYGTSLEEEQELVICIKDLIYSVGDENQTRIDVKISEGECFKITDYAQDIITFKSFNGGLTIRMKKNTFRYYFGLINSKGKSSEEFFSSKIFKEMEEYEN